MACIRYRLTGQWNYAGEPVLFLRYPLHKARLETLHLLVNQRWSIVRLEQTNHPILVGACRVGRERKRHPKGRLFRQIEKGRNTILVGKREAGWHHSDHGVGITVQVNRLSDDARISAEPAPPQPVAQ